MSGPRVLLLGVGNILMRDDGVGVHAVQALSDAYELPANLASLTEESVGLGCLANLPIWIVS